MDRLLAVVGGMVGGALVMWIIWERVWAMAERITAHA